MRKRTRTSLNSAVVNVWRRELGELSSRNFAHRLAASEDLVLRLDILQKLDLHRGCVNTISFNAAGDILVSGSDDRRIILWDWETGQPRLSFHSGHHNNVFQAKIMPYTDDRSFVTCAADGQVRHAQILDSGVVTKLLAKHHGRVHKLAVEPGSPHIFYTCGEDGLVLHDRVLNLIPHRIGFFPFGGFYDDDDFTDSADDEEDEDDDDDNDYDDDDDDNDDDDDDGGNCNNDDDFTDHDDCYSGNEVLNEEQQEEEEDNEGDDTTDFIFLGYADEDDFGSENSYDDGVEDISETEDDGDIEIAASDDSFGDICDNDYSDLGCDDNDFDDSKTETKELDAPYGFSRGPDVAVVFPKAKDKP
ncbi:UNVERIFIED_CONTAM: DDB1- and CUL4-associated factor 8 [Sesamum radiatum]|uniref:DDB1- and CUL4-associated factor 8 n=1 Tax=Sesamum radiatum TaxID=300843 RepID=A0AAW2RVM9_SESRA